MCVSSVPSGLRSCGARPLRDESGAFFMLLRESDDRAMPEMGLLAHFRPERWSRRPWRCEAPITGLKDPSMPCMNPVLGQGRLCYWHAKTAGHVRPTS